MDKWSSKNKKFVWILGTFFLYVTLFYLGAEYLGVLLTVLILIPVVFSAWICGVRVGLATTILAVLVEMGLRHIFAGQFFPSSLSEFFTQISALFALALIIGLLSDSKRRIEEELKERQNAEKELVITEEWYRGIFDGINDAVLVETTDGKVLDVNDRACEIFGWSQEEFLTKTIDDMVPEEYQALVVDDEDPLPEGEFESVNMRANGAYFPVSVSGRLHQIGNEKRLLVIVRDITEKKAIEDELNKNHQFLSHVIESLSHPFYVVNVEDYSIAIANSAARGLSGFDAKTTCYALTHQRDTPCGGDEHLCPLQEVLKTKQAVRVEHIHFNGEGEPRNVEVYAHPIFDARGQIVQMIESSVDITERKKSEEELLKLYRATNQSSASIVITNLHGDIEYVNPAFSEITGYSREEVLGKNPRILQSGLHDLAFYEELWNTIRFGDVWRGEFCNKKKSGEIFWESASIAPVQDAEGRITHYVAVKEDITEKNAILAEMERAKDAAEAAAKAKAEFLANMSHEIRTPLNAIYGMTSLMLNTPLNEEQQDFIETIRGGGETLLHVINDILDFSKIEAGKLELEEQPFYLRNCVEETLDLLAEKAAEKELELAYFIEDGTPPLVYGDITRLRQILVNLLNNGIKFTDTGEIVVNLSGRKSADEKYEIQISVRDTGIGIPEDKMGRLFQSFSQVDTSTTRKYGGTGLGLAISNDLAKAMGGKMWVESEEGVGSIFHFTILVAADPDAVPVIPTDELPKVTGKSILIVDDNATNRLILQKQAESWGMKPHVVNSAHEALDLLKTDITFDVGVFDMQMPEMDGCMLAKELNGKQDFPIVILTSLTHSLSNGDEPNVAALLSKPIKTANLFNVITHVMDSSEPVSKPRKLETSLSAEMAEKYPLTILLVEDNAINQKVALKLLSRLGYQADLANNGLEALTALKGQPYDVVFMDIQMPEMDGDEATQRIRAEWGEDEQPYIIAMTAHALEGDREKYLARGMNDYVSKPINVAALVAALKKVNG